MTGAMVQLNGDRSRTPSQKIPKSKKKAKLHNIAVVLHTVALGWYVYVWVWHFASKRAQVLPGAKGFGRFFRWITSALCNL
jgi:hypothetical protein